MLKAEMNLII